jgi:hypothetical protein
MGKRNKWISHIKPNLNRIPKLRRQGYTEEQIAKIIGVGWTTLKKYKKLEPSLLSALETGKEMLIEDLEETLYQKGLGGRKVTKIKNTYKTISGKKVIVKVEEQIDELSPDTGALIFALKNLAPDKWKDRREYETVTEEDKVIIVNALPKGVKNESKNN